MSSEGNKNILKTIPEICPLTESQKGIYLECINNPTSLMYNIPVFYRLPKNIDTSRFIGAVKTVASKHKVLNVTISAPDGIPSMIYHEKEITVTEKNITDIDEEYKKFLQPFDFEAGPLYRFEMWHCNGENVFIYDVHHIIFDGTSVKNFISQVSVVYDGGECPDEAMSVFDVAMAEKDFEETDKYKESQQFFEKKLNGIECDSKPVSDCITDEIKAGAGKLQFNSDGKLSVDDVVKITKEYNINENAFFLGVFAYALAKFSGTKDVFFTTANHGRKDKRLSDSFGMFVKTLPIYCDIDENMKVSDFLKLLYNDYYYTKHHDCISFGELVSKYGINIDVSFIYQENLLNGSVIGGNQIYTDMLNAGDLPGVIDFMVLKNKTCYNIMTHYKFAVYSEELITDFAKIFLKVATEMLKADTLKDIKFVDAGDKSQLDAFNKTESYYDTSKTVVDLFREQAQKTPDNICLVYNDKRYTYSEVDKITDILAKHLKKNGVNKEKVVGVLIPRCEYMLICSLGVLKAGGAYLPLDPTYPVERLNLMIQDSNAMMLIYSPEYVQTINSDFCGIRMSTEEILDLKDDNTVLEPPTTNDLFVMLYTSGSTGLPKGVMFEHSNVLVTAQWVKKYYGINENSCVTAYASYGFDANTYDMYPAIISGAQLHIISEEIRLDFIALRKYFNDNKITHTVMTTQVGRQFALMGGFDTLHYISLGGEKLTPLAPPDGINICNVYGPTEGSVITSAFCVDRHYKDIPIGKPVDNLKIYIVDKNGRLLPKGCTGELWISGPHVTRGYLNRPEKMAEAYGKNPFDTEKGYERVYRTGDIVRLLSDGNLQFVGRRDAQVKVRGFRIELTEVEEVIRRFDGVKNATVAAFDDPSGGKFIAAYIVSDNEISKEALADFIRSEKPPYMVPAVIMQIDTIPMTQNQKVNKKALPVPKRTFDDIVKPENDVQQKLFDIVSEVIGHNEFGVTTNIYDAGLTSIGTVKLNVMIANAFNTVIKIANIKANDTIKKLEVFINKSSQQKNYDLYEDYPITESQKGIFIECISAPDTTVYNIPLLLKISEKINTEQLVKSVKTAIDAHPYIKTTLFTDKSGDVRAKRNDLDEVDVSIIKCKELPDISSLAKPFKLLGEKLYRINIYEAGDEKYLFMDLHHIISDGTSENILLSDISRAYKGESLEKESFSGFEAALAEQETRCGERYEIDKRYWNDLLSGCETSCLPKYESETENEGSGCVRTEVSGTDTVKAFCKKNGLTLNSFFNSVFAFVLSKFANKDSLTYTTVFNGRNDSRLANAVMMLVRTVPVAVNMNDDISVKDYVNEMQNQLMESMAHDACSFAELSHEYDVKADIMFIYQGNEFKMDSLCGEKAKMLDVPLDTAKAPVTVNIYLKNDTFEYVIEYKNDLYNKHFAQCLADAISAAAKSFTECEYVKNASMMSDNAEKYYGKLNDSDMDVKEICSHQMIERFAKLQPDKTAVIAAGESLTYRELNEKANIVAHSLIRFGIEKEKIVGMVFDRTKEVFITELAILKSGGAFLPMLASYPDDRIDFCLTNADSPCVITTKAIKVGRPELFADDKPYKTLTVEELLSGNETNNPDIKILPEQLAYCIYTSGSTGTPKGVMIEHRNMSNMIQTHTTLYKAIKEDEGAFINISSISFDMSLYEIYLALCNGKTLCMASEEEIHNPLALIDLMTKHKVIMLACTPSFMNNIVTIPEFKPVIKQLVSLIMGAEAFPGSLYDVLRDISPNLQIVNGYGPTETTMCCSTKELSNGKSITIGRPTGNAKMYVVDKFGNVLPPYAIGELIICGALVGRGYVKLPEKNKASFFKLRGLPAYHSGDLVRLNFNSEIEFGGRIDNQVKLRGFRVELDEIEKVMISFDSLLQSKVFVRNNGTEDYLVGFFTAEKKIDIDELTNYMKSRLTYYMVPAAMMQLEQMPLTPNGKIDKKAFPEIKQSSTRKSGRRAPKKSLEQRLCEIFSSVLNIDEIFADDNFFELGGTSLTASKVTMLLMSENIEIKYGDIFDYPTPEELADFIEQRDTGIKEQETDTELIDDNITHPALKWNTVKYAHEVKRESIGNVLLTGAVGFLGIHVLKELLELEEGHIWCLVRRGGHDSAEKRLKTMLVYYFSNGFEEEFKNRISVLEADITDNALDDILSDIPFDTIINCAACVKHFSDNNILENINVGGVKNLIEICKKRNTRLVQISTVSVPGIHTKDSYEKQIKMHENELFMIDDMDNKYIISKHKAELCILDAIENDNLRAKIIRVGNLMGRQSDGEFQVNFETNMFMSGIRGFSIMGKYPISHMTDPMSFSPVDCTARAVVLLAGTNDKFTAFNANNRYGFDEMKIIDACNRNGIAIYPEADEIYYEEFRQKLGDDEINKALNGLAAYDIKDGHSVETDNLFTTNVLYRIGFSWPLVDDSYLDKAINSIMTLDYFNMFDTED